MDLFLVFLYNGLDKTERLDWLLEKEEVHSSDNQFKG